MAMISRTAWVLAVAALVAAACGDGEEGSSASRSPTASHHVFADSFLNDVAAAVRPADEILSGFLQTIEGTYQDREAYFAAVSELGLLDAIGALQQRATTLVPPAEHAENHALWVANLQTEVSLAAEFDAALQARDLGALSIAAARLNAAFSGLLLEVTSSSPEFCRALTLRDPGAPDETCVGPGQLPPGEYGAEANRISRRVAATVFPLIGTPPLRLLTDEEELAVLAEVQPEAEAGFARAQADLEALTPPDELAEDHAAALAYLRDIADVARRITEAAEAQDVDALAALYEESARPGLVLRQALTEDGQRVFGALVPG
ncbi:MAG: hypothetical protein R3249_05665 [Nitriliruptorales bacterium]|nr:hypothetical protein [Nitriliruptorales bacterium]